MSKKDELPIMNEEAELLVLRVFMSELIFILSNQKPNPRQASQQLIERLAKRIDAYEAKRPERGPVYEHARQILDRHWATLSRQWDDLGNSQADPA